MGFLIGTFIKIFTYIALIFFFAPSLCKCLTIDLDDYWETFKTVFEKIYSTKEEDAIRRQCFEENVAMITKHNLQENMQKHSFILGINHLSDMVQGNAFLWLPESSLLWSNKTIRGALGQSQDAMIAFTGYTHSTEEIKKQMSCYHEEAMDSKTKFVQFYETDTQPVELDYRKQGMVGSVPNQGSCGGCYAFSAMGALEAQMKKKSGKLVELSPQNIIDCTRKEGNKGCENGLMAFSYEYVIENNGVNSLSAYPYEAKEGKCRFNSSDIAGTCRNYSRIVMDDEQSLYLAVGWKGPVSVGIYANQLFHHYKEGIFDISICDPKLLNHAILIIGYGEENGKNYWIAKNSYGERWGNKGYVKIVRGKNMCGIARQASFPTV